MIIRPGPVARQPVSAVSLGRCGHGGQGQSDMSWRSGDIRGLAGSCCVTTWGWGLGDPRRAGCWHGRSFLIQVQRSPGSPISAACPGSRGRFVCGLGHEESHGTTKSEVRTRPERSSRLSLNTSMDGELIPFRGQIFIDYLLYAGHWGSRTEQSGKKVPDLLDPT